MDRISYFKLIICLLLPFAESINIYGPHPRIISSGGELKFISAEHKNIVFKTSGTGRIYLNGEDLSKAADMALNTSKLIQKYTTTFEASIIKIEKFEHMMEGEDGILSKLTSLESGTTNSSDAATASIGQRKFQNLVRRVKILTRRLNTLSTLLVKDECISNPCKNGGTCVDMFNNFMCQCPPQWEGRDCSKDVNECARFVGTDLGCQNGATCINRQGSYECQCRNGWFGIHCTRRSTDCNSAGVELCGHGTCISTNTETGYTCICDQGWTTDGNKLACTRDVDECKLNHPPCSVNPLVQCINVPGSFYCGSCPPGYTGNGYYCTDINECEILNGGCSVAPMVQCINTLGSRNCGLCPPGYVGDGVTCVFSGGGVCSVNNGGCHMLAHCSNNPSISSTLVQCTCPSGYVGNGVGPTGCRRSSQVGDACLSNPCLHDGVCSPHPLYSYSCTCNKRYSGRNCERLSDNCTPNPCQNNGTCFNMYSRFRCVCPSNYMGIRCQIQRQTCGGRLKASEGTLKYPLDSITSTYNNHISCAWVIETNSSKVLTIKFIQFSLENSKSCQNDWLQIHDGKNSASHNLGRFCGDKLPNNGTIVTTHNFVYLWFRSDHNVAKSGFELTWNSTEPECGDIITISSHGSLQSPGSPGNYPVNRDCYWTLLAPAGKRIVFNFFTLMLGNNLDCNGDYLEFISGSSQNDPVFAKFCNSSRPAPLYSHGSDVLVHFHSDNNDTYPGFQITYSTAEGFPGCGGMYTSSSGEIRSPLDNGKYPSEITCEYKIKIPQSYGMQRILLSFTSFNLENSEECQFDSLTIYDGLTTDAPLIGKYCGQKIPAPYISNSMELLIVFKSDWASNEGGFILKYNSICGSKFSDPTGIIQRPMFNGYIECIFEIEQPLGKLIKLNFTEFNVSSDSEAISSFQKPVSDTCSNNYVEVRDGDNENAMLLGNYCTARPPILLSSTNHIWMKLVSNNRGISFKLNYTSMNLGCGGILKNKVGSITSPPSSMSATGEIIPCRWVLSAPPDNVVKITWLNINIYKDASCAVSSVSVYDNNTEAGIGDLMGKYCGSTLPPTIMSTSNVVTIVYEHTSLPALLSEDFLISYNFIHESSVCGGNYFSSVGVIKSPSYPANYPTNKHCTWKITVPPGHQIMLNVTDFNIENYFNCRYDHLEIRNGGTMASPLIGKFCGKTIPKLIPSHTNQLYLFFHSDMTATGHGFKILWQATATGCGGTLSGPSGSIISPHYPEPYTRNTECFWKISTNAGSIIQIVIADLELEMHVSCLLDYIEIYDGLTLNSPKLGRYCSSTHPPYIRSTSNYMMIKFRSDVSFQGHGFNILYTSLCNNTLTGFRGVIESLNFPRPYPQNQNCLWEIKVPSMNKINITFSHFNLEKSIYSNNTCFFDYLEVKYAVIDMNDVENETVQKYGTYCGNIIPEIIHLNSNKAQIHFVSDSLSTGDGFRLEWQLDGCGGLLTHPKGTISSPNYPKPYPTYIECNWIIQVDFGHSIELTFGSIDTENYKSCAYDYIKIYNGKDDTYPLITTLCHQENNTIISSSSNFMFVSFVSDSSYSGKGFMANYITKETKCSGKFTADQGIIVSPNYPKNYDPRDMCSWSIEVEDNHVIELKFEDVDLLKFAGACSFNYIKVFDGPSSGYPVLAKICESVRPNKTIVSSYNHLFIEFHTSNTTSSKGFKAVYQKGCGARISTIGSGLIQFTPNTMLHHENDSCSWTIVAEDQTQHISLFISHISYDNMDCYENPIKIYSGETEDAPLIGSYCAKIPPTIRSSGSALHIKIDEPLSFFATYTVFDSKCGGTLNAMEGSIATPDFPNSYPNKIQCEWTIKSAQGNHLTIVFETFELLDSPNCNTDYLEIRKNSSSGKLLGLYCGTNRPQNLTHLGNLWLFLQTSSIQQGEAPTAKGFFASYKLELSNSLSGSSGVIESPLYPLALRTNTNFEWTITVAVSKRIVLTFEEFYLENTGDDCFYTYLEIFDGTSVSDPSLGMYCGFEKPTPIYTTSNNMHLSLVYRYVRGGSNFRVNWLEVPKKPLKPNLSMYDPKLCGNSEPIDLSGIHTFNLTSPGYPNGYENHIKCEWTFTTTSNNHLEIIFTDIDLEKTLSYFRTPNMMCFQDYIEVFEGINGAPDWKSLGRQCKLNKTEDVYKIHSNLLKVRFVTSRTINATGFSSIIKEVCGGTVKETAGTIIYDSSTAAANDKECQWNVTVRSGKTIEITFPLFNIAHNDKGCNNYLVLRNGIHPDSPFLGNGKYCGKDIPQMLNTTGNHLYVKYVGSTAITGFRLAFKEKSVDCGGIIALDQFVNSTEITSPNYPNIPQPHIECYWTILAPPGKLLRVDFEERFDLTQNKGCTLEYVELRDGGTKYSPIIDRFCDEMPSSQFSTDNIILIKFFTDVEDPKNGFKAKIQIDSCGGTIRSNFGSITSPYFNMKDSYPTNINCTWNIVVPNGYYIKLNFQTIDLPKPNKNCSYVDHVSIYETTMLSTFHYGNFCGKSVPDTIQSFSNKLIINFATSKKSLPLAGFKLVFNASQEKCGGQLYTAMGSLFSPGYPNSNYGSHRSCMWIITVSKGRRIELQILDNDVDPVSKDNGVAFFNGAKFESGIITLKNGQKMDFIKSSDNIMTVFLWMSGNSGHRGFSAIYTSFEPTICEGNFNQTSGTIQQPTTQGNFTGYLCIWERTSDHISNQTVAVTINMVLEPVTSTPYCRNSPGYITVFTVPGRNFIDEVCKTTKHVIRSPYFNTKIKAVRKVRSEVFNFTIDYKVHPCGGLVEEETGIIKSPGYPNTYSDSVECSWLIKLPVQQTVKITFDSFDLGSDCDKSYVVIYNGRTPRAPRIGKYCKNNKPAIIKSQSNEIWIDYHYEFNSGGKGFSLNYEPVVLGCGGIYHDKRRVIQSPQYPDNYPNNAECEWEVVAKDGFHIGLVFLDRFFLEQSDNCANDYIEVFDYKYDNWVSLGKNCGHDFPPAMNSTGNRMKILFRSNKDITGRGFKAQWQLNCGGILQPTTDKQYLVSPGYPQLYFPRLDCTYNIISPIDKTLVVVFEDFSLESGQPDCKFDNVTVVQRTLRDPAHINLTTVLCGEKLPPAFRVRGNMIIRLQTDIWLQKRGFRLYYYLEACGGHINQSSIISSLSIKSKKVIGYSFTYTQCFWQIEAPPGKIITLNFLHFILTNRASCFIEALDIYDDTRINYNKRLATLCGDLEDNLPVIKSTGNKMSILLKGSVLKDNEGFTVNVLFTHGPAEGCGGNITVNKKIELQSPNLMDMDCGWLLEAPSGHSVQIEINSLNLPIDCESSKHQSTRNCTCSYLQIVDGGSLLSPMIEEMCGGANSNFLKRQFVTSSKYGFIRLFMIGKRENVFRITLSPIMSKCGELYLNVTKELQVIKSPDYPNPYPDDLKCNWLLRTANMMEKIHLHFVDFDLNENNLTYITQNTCDQDKLVIAHDDKTHYIRKGMGPNVVYSGKNVYYKSYYDRLGNQQFCGKNDLPFDYYSKTNYLYLSFTSGFAKNRGRGFKIEYQIAGCNRNFTTDQGEAQAYKIDGHCYINIQVQPNRTINIYFLQFLFTGNSPSRCDKSEFEVRDGPLPTSNLLSSFCGYTEPSPIFSTGNQVWIHAYKKQPSFNPTSYNFIYTSTDQGRGCGGKIYNYKGKFTSPLYPGDYRISVPCTWDIRVPINTMVALHFLVFNLQGPCTDAYVTVITYDNNNINEHKFCKNSNPAILYSDSRITVRYQSSNTNIASGWVARFNAINDKTNSNPFY